MPIKVVWDSDDRQVVRWSFPPEWTWDDFYTALKSSRALVQDVDHTVDVLVDMTQARALPNNVLTQTQVTMQTSPLNIGVVVVIGFNSLIRTAFNTFQRLYRNSSHSSRRELYIVNMEHKAYQILEERRQSRRNLLEQ